MSHLSALHRFRPIVPLCLVACLLAGQAGAQVPLKDALDDIQAGRWAAAVAKADAALDADPGRTLKADALWMRAMARHGLGEYVAALKDAGAAIALDAGHAAYREQRIRTALRLGRPSLALADFAHLERPGGGFERGVIRAPLMYLYRATARFLTGDFAAAFQDYDRALAAEPENPAFLHAAAWALATVDAPGLRDAGRALELARKAARLGNSGAVQNVVGAAHVAMGEFDKAVDAYKAAVALDGKPRIDRYQAYLHRLGYDLKGEDGVFGPKTRAALEECVRAWCQLLAE